MPGFKQVTKLCQYFSIFCLFPEFGKANPWLTITLSLIGKFFITCSFATIYVHTPEIYPTKIRNTGLGLCMLIAKVASIVAPSTRILVSWSVRVKKCSRTWSSEQREVYQSVVTSMCEKDMDGYI